jgi:hypothetical protein
MLERDAPVSPDVITHFNEREAPGDIRMLIAVVETHELALIEVPPNLREKVKEYPKDLLSANT